MVGCAKLPLENNPLHIWGLHILWHRVESKHQNGNRCEASRLLRTAACMLCVFSHLSLSLSSLGWPNTMPGRRLRGGWKNRNKSWGSEWKA